MSAWSKTAALLFGALVLIAAGCGKEEDSSRQHPNQGKASRQTTPESTTKGKQVPRAASRPLTISWAQPMTEPVLVAEPPDILYGGGQSIDQVEAVIKIELLDKGEKREISLDSEKRYSLATSGRIVLRDPKGESVWGVVVRMLTRMADPDSEGKIRIAFYRPGFKKPGFPGLSTRPDDDRLSEWLELRVRAK